LQFAGVSADRGDDMRRSLALAGLLLLAFSPTALASSAGGATYPTGSSGGTQFGAASTSRPTVAGFTVPKTVRAPRLPVVRFRIDETGARAVRVRIAVLPLGAGAAGPQSIELGRQVAGRVRTVAWPRGTELPAGRYLVRLHAVDDAGHTLVRPAYASGRATLTVLAAKKQRPKKTATPKPATPAPASTPAGPAAPTAPVTPAATTTAGVFPVQAPHTYGDPFGTPRPGHSHQGQDVLAAEGSQVVAPTAGTITSNSYQAAAAGYYVVMHAADGRDFFFAHCQANSFGQTQGATVAAGAPLCRLGHTGDATGPHLHFEIWVGGWHVGNGAPIDPLPQLKAWDTPAAR
jgi:murein DD-endopeptidase MepM/ murein hydrolase activator NlpD